MLINVSDSNIVGEAESTLFSTIQQGPVDMLVVMKNSGVNPIRYRYDEYIGTGWSELGASGSEFQDILDANQVLTLKVSSNYPQVRLTGSASGGSLMEFSITRYHQRACGGPVPILSL